MDKFELQFTNNYFKKEDIINDSIRSFKVISTPKPHYIKWYFRILNYLTFKTFFNVKYTYTVKEI